jgi:L-alanine-DL-glutamate epimerase-like enolase superfamily enzyme
VDANQGFTRPFLERLMPVLIKAKVELIEQPFPIGLESLLDDFDSPIPIGADESVQCLADIPSLVGRFDVINIKLDKCGGLTEGLAMAKAAREHGFKVMVGAMLGTSLAMAPGFVLGQLADIVDLDVPIFLKRERPDAVRYDDGLLSCPEALWGYPD